MLEQVWPGVADQPGWLRQAVEIGLAAALAVAVATAAHWIVFRVLSRLARGSENESDDILVRRLSRPALLLAARELPVLEEIWARIAGFVMPALVGWIAVAIIHALVEAMKLRADITVADNLHARRQRTRLAMVSRIATFVVVFVTVGLMLLSIPGVRDIGLTLVASAGLAGLAVGAAAQPALKALIAGVQMAFTEPINVDDVVIIDGEWGRIEDIRTTYVVVKIWDERRLVVPTTKFLEEPFQNWTKQTADLLGTVFLHVDPAAKVAPIREEFERQVSANEHWDGRVRTVQVTGTSPDSKEVRLLMSARNSGELWDLRCDVREGMTEWLAETMPEAIVRRRYVRIDEDEAAQA
mgnify:CR=1 FL=1